MFHRLIIYYFLEKNKCIKWLDIDKTEALSSGVPSDLSSARGVSETHSYGGASCNMPSAIDYVAQAIEKVDILKWK